MCRVILVMGKIWHLSDQGQLSWKPGGWCGVIRKRPLVHSFWFWPWEVRMGYSVYTKVFWLFRDLQVHGLVLVRYKWLYVVSYEIAVNNFFNSGKKTLGRNPCDVNNLSCCNICVGNCCFSSPSNNGSFGMLGTAARITGTSWWWWKGFCSRGGWWAWRCRVRPVLSAWGSRWTHASFLACHI